MHWKTRQKWMKFLLGAITFGFLAYQWFPILIMAVLSFTGPEGGVTFPMHELSLHWYREFLADAGADDFKPPMYRSLLLGLMCSITTAGVSLAAAQAMRSRFFGSNLYFYMILLGIMAPGILVGLGMAVVARILGIPLTWYTTTFVVHMVWTLPFGLLLLMAAFNRFDIRLEEAALTLGASRRTVFWRITFPLVLPGVIGAGLFGFTLSYDEFARSLFSTGYEQTLPIIIFAQFDQQLRPTLYAIGTTTTVFSLLMIGFFAFLFHIVRRRGRSSAAAIT